MIESVMFFLFAGLLLGSAIGCVLTTNIVRTAMYLFGALAGVAGLYFLLFANLLGAIQLIVYAGGTLILIIFGVMLTSKSPWLRFAPRKWEIGAAAVLGVVLFIGLAAALGSFDWTSGAARPLTDSPKVADVGRELLTTWLAPFELASVLLLVVMIGAAYLARPERNERAVRLGSAETRVSGGSTPAPGFSDPARVGKEGDENQIMHTGGGAS